jgi:hypothetical protein
MGQTYIKVTCACRCAAVLAKKPEDTTNQRMLLSAFIFITSDAEPSLLPNLPQNLPSCRRYHQRS